MTGIGCFSDRPGYCGPLPAYLLGAPISNDDAANSAICQRIFPERSGATGGADSANFCNGRFV